jgi:hypothetical protein
MFTFKMPVAFPTGTSLRGFQEGGNLCVLRAKEEKVAVVEVIDAHLPPKAVVRYHGYALKMTWDALTSWSL